jgi:hypothetical protein
MPRTYVHFLITKNDIRRSVELRRFWMLGRNIAFEPGFMRNLIGGAISYNGTWKLGEILLFWRNSAKSIHALQFLFF